MDEAHGKLSWCHDQYQDAIKNTKSLQEQLYSKKECHCKAESELHHLQKEGKSKGKQREVSATCKWWEWKSAMDSDIAEQTLSKTSRKQRAMTQVHRMFCLGEWLNSLMLNPYRWAPIWCSPLLGQNSRCQRPECPPWPLCHHLHWHHCCGGKETPLHPSQGNGPIHLVKPRQV